MACFNRRRRDLRDLKKPFQALGIFDEGLFGINACLKSGYDQVFARQVEGLGQSGDLLIGISTSGNSKNVVKAIEVAQSKGIRTVALVGDKPEGAMQTIADYVLAAPSTNTARIQECHILIMHTLCQLVESESV